MKKQKMVKFDFRLDYMRRLMRTHKLAAMEIMRMDLENKKKKELIVLK